MPTVLLLFEYASLNGGERSILATLDPVRRAGFEIIVAAPPAGPLAETLAARGIEVIPLAKATRQALADILARRRFDLLHANSLAMGRLSGPVARAAGLPSLAHLRDIVGLSRQAMADLNCHRRLLAVSRATRDFHVAAGLAAEKTHVLHNGVDLDQFRPRPPTGYLHRELGLAPGAILAGSIGQIGLRKGHDVLLAAAARLASRLPELHWLLIGCRYSEKEESRRLEEQLHRAAEQLEGRFHFLGQREDISLLLGELAILVHPARQEPLGRVLLEAAASGLAVVATDVGGTREIFPPQPDSARLVLPGDPEALGAAVAALVTDGPARRRLGAAARLRAQEGFSLVQAASGLMEHYQAIL
jgi:glycosyltransferase involved in cell wall biosynthesis